MVTGVPNISAKDRRRALEEDSLKHTMRLLTEYKFHFKDLGLTQEQAEYGRTRIRRRILKVMNALAAAQSKGGSAFIYLGGRQLANSVAYETAEHWGFLTLGTAIEMGASVLPFEWNESWARLNIAFGIKDIASLIGGGDPRSRFTLAAGPELELLAITDTTLQPNLGVRAGYQFGTRDTFGTRTCTEGRAISDSRNCSQFIIQSYFALGLLETFRIEALFEFFPLSFDFGHDIVDVQLLFGVQFF